MRHICRRAALLSAVAVLLAGCSRDQLDNVHQCLVVSPDNSWSSNGVGMDVTAPVCPVVVGYSGDPIYFSARTRAPSNMPAGNLNTTIIDLTGDQVTDLLGLFQPISSTTTEAFTTGYYSAGRDGIPLVPDRPIQDRGYAQFSVSPALGGGVASAFALLPYKITNPPISAKITPSNWTSPKVGVPTIVRIVPQLNEQASPIRNLVWSFDGRGVLDSAMSRDPRYPIYYGKRVLSAKVWTRGVHTWKVDMTYGTWPYEKSASVTWKQTFY